MCRIKECYWFLNLLCWVCFVHCVQWMNMAFEAIIKEVAVFSVGFEVEVGS